MSEAIPWRTFLESQPPGQARKVTGIAEERGDGSHLVIPALQMYCGSVACDGVCFFDSETTGAWLSHQEPRFQFLAYHCRHCMQTEKIFAVMVKPESSQSGEALKLGEYPGFGPHIPTKMFSLLGEDQELFHKGRRAESQGMGIGAFAYYRRVVENQKNRLIDEIIKVSRLLKAAPGIIDGLEAARKETQFHKAVQIVKEGIPEVLRISGHNPLTLLHTALSDGLHGKTDEECLVRATSIRLVLATLSERIVEALKDEAELNQAVSKLLQIQSVASATKSAAPPAQ